jgi:hypothetical protein
VYGSVPPVAVSVVEYGVLETAHGREVVVTDREPANRLAENKKAR